MDPWASPSVDSATLLDLGTSVLLGLAIAACAIAVGVAASVIWETRKALQLKEAGQRQLVPRTRRS